MVVRNTRAGRLESPSSGRMRRARRLRSFWAATGAIQVAFAYGADDDLALVRQHEAARVETLARAAHSVVCIYEDRERSGGGSGVVIAPDGYGLTNFHVVASMLESRRGFGGLPDGKLYPLRVLGIDPGGDVAMFKLDGAERFDFLSLADSDELRAGQWVAALGNPFLLAEDYTPTITLGVVSGLHRYQYGQGNLLEYADCIQVSTSINPGNSGGPLVDMTGRLVGVVGRASFEERGRVNVGLGYAVTTNQIRRFLPALRAGRLCEHGTLGATVELLGDELIFHAVQSLSAAERGGVELGDGLVAINARPVRTPNEYNNVVAVLPAEWPVSLTVRRQGQLRTPHARLARLTLRDVPLFVPDLDVNHAEVRRLLVGYEQADRGAPGRRVASLHGQARTWTPSVPSTPPGGWTFTLTAAEAVSEGGPDAALLTEWYDVVWPLLGGPEVGMGWDARGGDELDGRLAAVVERRLEGGRRVRWKFDFESHELLEATVGNESQPESAVWWPGPRRPCAELRWPHVWRRRTADGAELEIRIESCEVAFESAERVEERAP